MHKHHPLLIGLLTLAACSGGSNAGNANPPTPPPANPQATLISDVQGNGDSSPLEGQRVTVEGIVTGDFQDDDGDADNNLGGFYLQAEIGDGDPSTSDGVFIFDGNSSTIDVAVGDRVEVDGTVAEFFGETQIAAEQVRVTGNGSVAPVDVTLPVANVIRNSSGDRIADLEHLEGMLVRFEQTLTVGALFELENYGSLSLNAGGRAYQFTNQNAPSARGYSAHRDALAARTVWLDDGQRERTVRPVRYLSNTDPLRTGDAVTGLTATVRYSRGSGGQGNEAYRLMPTTEPAFDSVNLRPGTPAVDGALRVASFNTLNLFSTIDRGARACGPDRDDGCRGADSQAELDRQVAKLAAAIELSGADIIGLMEIENNGGPALALITDTLNGSGGSYDFVDAGFVGSDVITTGFIYDSATVTPVGTTAILDDTVDARFNDQLNRPALAQAFEQNSNGARFSVVVNHLKSKGSSCSEDGDPNRSDGQGNCNGTRTAAAEAIADWIATDPTDSGDDDYLVIGDLNAYLLEDPLDTLKDAGMVSLIEDRVGVDAWSFVFDGQSGALDHALANNTLAPQVADTIEWHINADEPPALDYNLEGGRNPSLFDADSPYRASDHDPILIGLDLTP